MNDGDDGLRPRLGSLATVFLKLGVLGFGGPAAHLALLEDEVVTRRRWISRQQFLDLVGATHLIPGPNSTEMAIHVGLLRAGWRGMVLAGACFILPAVVMTLGFAWLYVRYRTLPAVAPFLEGIQPAVLAVILVAVIRLGRTAARTWRRAGIGVAVALAILLGADEVIAFLAGGVLGMFVLVRMTGPPASGRSGPAAAVVPSLGPALGGAKAVAVSAATATGFSHWSLGLFFLKVGAVLYGGGYVLIAYLEGDLVREWGWLSETELLDAVAVGQFTPGPILSTATFVGYLLAGGSGAVVATTAIFLPSFVFVLLLRRYLPKLREGTWKPAFLDSVNVSAVGLMTVALLKLARTGLLERTESGYAGLDPAACAISLLAAFALLRWKLNPVWVVLGGAVAGGLLFLVR